MQQAEVAIIGGTGIGSRLAQLGGVRQQVETDHGPMEGTVFEFEGLPIMLVERHSAGHKQPPHLINYRAIAEGMKRMGVKTCLASAAVGSLRPDWGVGSFAICRDFLDFTARNLTMHERTVTHVDFSEPMPASRWLAQSCKELGAEAQDPAVYVCANGPRYETPAEIRMMRMLGGDVVGMTAASEAVLTHELGIDYGCFAVVTNLGTGLASVGHDHGAVSNVMEQEGERVVKILLNAARLAAQ